MSLSTSIEWCTASWNPIRSLRNSDGSNGFFCVKYSPGCANCYAASMNIRGLPGAGNGLDYVAKNEKLQTYFLDQVRLFEPIEWRKPKDIFVCSMTDWMLDNIPWHFAFDMLAVANMLPRHRWLFLTKRAKTMGRIIGGADFNTKLANRIAVTIADGMPPLEHYSLNNCWFGISAESQEYLDSRMAEAQYVVARGRNVWVSAEPLLGPLKFDFSGIHAGIKTVVVGGESGPRRLVRECRLKWILDIVSQCRDAGVPVFVKQLGGRCIGPRGEELILKDSKGGDIDEWPVNVRVRDLIFGHVPERTLLV